MWQVNAIKIQEVIRFWKPSLQSTQSAATETSLRNPLLCSAQLSGTEQIYTDLYFIANEICLWGNKIEKMLLATPEHAGFIEYITK